jgi:hypothetical protein
MWRVGTVPFGKYYISRPATPLDDWNDNFRIDGEPHIKCPGEFSSARKAEEKCYNLNVLHGFIKCVN